MWALLIPLISQMFGEKGPLGQYFKIKADTITAENTYRLEILKAQTEAAKADVQQTSDRLGATSQSFKEMTFWFICIPVIVTIIPFTSGFAVTMWHNFTLIPEWFQILFVSVYSSIWGLPIAKEYLGGMFKSLGRGIEARREYKLNRAAIFASLKQSGMFKGSEKEVSIIDSALNEGEK